MNYGTIALGLGFLLLLTGLWGLLTRKNLIQIVIGFSVFDTGLHVIMVGIGYIRGRTAPILDEAAARETAARTVVDPVPQALVLTAIADIAHSSNLSSLTSGSTGRFSIGLNIMWNISHNFANITFADSYIPIALKVIMRIVYPLLDNNKSVYLIFLGQNFFFYIGSINIFILVPPRAQIIRNDIIIQSPLLPE